MSDQENVVSFSSVDEKLTLGIWVKDGAPRLLIENNAKKTGAKKKFIHLSWVEKEDRKLSISGQKKNETYNYEMRQIEPTIKHILEEFSVYSKYKMFYWKTVSLLTHMVETPVNIIDPVELVLMPEKKRCFLWVCDMTKDRNEGFYRPFFPMEEAEKNVLPSPEGVPFSAEQKGSEYFCKTGTIRKLMGINSARWYRPLQIAAAAMLLSFSFCGENGSEVSGLLWRERTDEPIVLKPDDPKMVQLGERLNMYIRHFSAIKNIRYEEGVYDSVAELIKQGYIRKKRLNLHVGAIGDVEYTATVLEKDNEPIAFACAPKSVTARHENDIVYHIPQDVFNKAKLDSTLDKDNLDEFYTLASLIRAKQCSNWLERIAYFVSAFTGVKPENA